MTIIPEGQEVQEESKPLDLTEQKKTEMIVKAKEILTGPMSANELSKKLEHFYIYGHVDYNNYEKSVEYKSLHYTSRQLKEIIDQVIKDLEPEIEETITT